MRKAKAYLCMQYRGDNGDDATDAEIQANIEKARQVAFAIRRAFPESLDLYVPHFNEDIVHRLWKKGLIDSDDILDICCDIVAEQDFLIAIGSMSDGMMREQKHAISIGRPVIRIDVFDDDAKEHIGLQIARVQVNGEDDGD